MSEAIEHMVEVTDETFEQMVLKSATPVVVDFWAPWCPPCRAIAPILADLARDYAGRLTIVKVNSDDNPSIVQSLGVLGIPTLTIFKGGQEVSRIVGARPKQGYQKAFNAVLA